MKVADFDYTLPKESIAQFPKEERDLSRLLVYRKKDGNIEHRIFRDIVEFFKEGDVLVLNNTKVLPAKIEAENRKGKKIEMLLIEKKEGNKAICLVHRKKGKQEEEIKVGSIKGILRKNDKFWICEFEESIEKILSFYGKMPLPPYIKRESTRIDFERYQTIYAEIPGSIAAPTAGFHFTEGLLLELEKRGTIISKITLHIGIGTFFLPKGEEVEEHNMEKEFYFIDEETKERILLAKREKRRIIACGTSVVRALETVFSNPSMPLSGYTNLFIFPGYNFKVVDGLITNFHLPRSTPLLLVAAFIGRDELLRCYEEAIKKGYRFLSYGDAMLII